LGGYIDKIRLQALGLIKYIITIEYLLNRLTPLYSKNHYKEEKYLIIKIGSLYTWLPFIVIAEYTNTFGI
jgi:hypothetical protein